MYTIQNERKIDENIRNTKLISARRSSPILKNKQGSLCIYAILIL